MVDADCQHRSESVNGCDGSKILATVRPLGGLNVAAVSAVADVNESLRMVGGDRSKVGGETKRGRVSQLSSQGIWNPLKEALRQRLTEQAFATWISQMVVVRDDGRELILGLPSSFSLDWVSDHYRYVIEQELAGVAAGITLELRLVDQEEAPLRIQPAVAAGSSPPSRRAGPRIAPMAGRDTYRTTRPFHRPLSLPDNRPPLPAVYTPMNERYTFQTFVTGPSNELAAAAAQSVADHPGRSYNPLFVFGRVGLGKTHLIQAIGHRVRERYPEKRVQYQTTEQFVNDVVSGIRFERMDEIRAVYRACDVLIIDDIQFISGKEASQAEFFHTFNALYDAKKQVVVTSDKLPHELRGLEERIRSRFQWGLIVDLQPPELETRVAIVKKKADTDQIPLSDEVALFVAQSIRSNVRELEGCLIRVAAYAKLTNQEISISLAKSVLKDLLPNKGQLTCDTIVKTVANFFDVKVADLKSAKRGRTIAYPRQVAMFLCRRHTGSSYPEIGNALGGKDHTTALNAFNRISARLDEPDVRRHVEELERRLLN